MKRKCLSDSYEVSCELYRLFFIANLEGRRKHHDCHYWNNKCDKRNKLARLYRHSVSFYMRKFRQYRGGAAFSFL